MQLKAALPRVREAEPQRQTFPVGDWERDKSWLVPK